MDTSFRVGLCDRHGHEEAILTMKYFIDMESYEHVVFYLEAIERRQLGRDD